MASRPLRVPARTLIQLAFLGVTAVGVYLVRGNAERWCPFGGIESLYTYATERSLPCSLGVSNLYILLGILGATLLARRVFCSHACPIGTLSEWLGRLGRRVGIRRVRVSRGVDRALGAAKYLVLGVILWFTWRASELVFRGYDPCYALIGRNGTDITVWAYVVTGAIGVASLFLAVPFCRWLCPFAAVLQPFSAVGLLRVRRTDDGCADCGRCTAACPMGIPVDRLEEVASPSCTACGECLRVCKVRGKPPLRWALPRWKGPAIPKWIPAAVILAGVAVSVGAARLFPAPSYSWARGERPDVTAVADLDVTGLDCRGRATLLVFFLDRDDEFALPGYVKLDAWPGPGAGRARIDYDPATTTAEEVRRSLSEPYFNLGENVWYPSPFAPASRIP